MRKPSLVSLLAATAVVGASLNAEGAESGKQKRNAVFSLIGVDKDITLRRMVVHSARQKGTVLFLHGFPETSYVWIDISIALGADYEVHAFDWPGYGLSSRPAVEKFSYAPKDYADVLHSYIEKAGIDRSNLTIYATDIGALPALLLALREPDIAQRIIVGDFAPFNRPAYMYESLQSLKAEPAASKTRDYMNKTSNEILENAHRRGLAPHEQFEIPAEVKEDMKRSWSQGGLTTADAFYHYYAKFTRDQDFLEANLSRLKTPVKVIWGEKDIYINKEMGLEFSKRTDARISVLPGIGHYPHLQKPELTVREIREAPQ
ncbi:alpha/beta fold hydrolase [Sinorhizobium meliloti]|uniref:alpha/beta fold hydrolase n=1 Tax=Rhizobium meliloti TaxID=382 RepID=UPI000B5A5AC4|nr:alpha/beta hydrolase [Sinorhizobium meliloti]ASJ62151.1 alpha/beta hydrolase [Sinorhizobium meliloti]MCK3784776.1 alpha/beta hydrolase [Sinorhizobium meliloti]MCK3790901.1 alpha/beta hydrolase [Sinorhizobium meliloti]MCK3797970.1 alpha/beta hydrolase [Sinorhizobium meliloti]MDW9552726.1 alpha/beta fold hydrolase [Sinorhizobium meliloti]